MNKIGIIFIILVILLALILLFVHCKINLCRYIYINSNSSYLLTEVLKNYHKKEKALDNKVVISLTTIPTRINTLYKTIYSLLDQSHRVDEIILNIPYTSLKGVTYSIPLWLKKCIHNNFIILNRCEDIGPITKLVPTINMYKNQNVAIIVVDDDTIYKSTIIHELCKNYKKYNCAISATGYTFFNRNGSKREYNTKLGHYMKHVDVLMGYNGYIVNSLFFKDDWDTFRLSNHLFFYVDDDCISLYLNKHHIHIYALSKMEGCSLPQYNYLIEWFFYKESDSLSRTHNKSISSSKLFGKKEEKVLRQFGYYLTDYSFISWLIK